MFAGLITTNSDIDTDKNIFFLHSNKQKFSLKVPYQMTGFTHLEMLVGPPKESEGMANSEDPGQSCWLGSRSCWYSCRSKIEPHILYITKTCPCNKQRFFTAVKMKIFR